MNPAGPFAGRVALVTGGGGAIGRAIAGRLGAAGVAVAVVATSTARTDATVEAVRAAVLRALTINVASVVALAGVVIPAMSRSGWGRIVNICGVVGNLAFGPGGNIYAVCAAALEAHTVNLAAELTGTGITVNALRAQKMGVIEFSRKGQAGRGMLRRSRYSGFFSTNRRTTAQ